MARLGVKLAAGGIVLAAAVAGAFLWLRAPSIESENISEPWPEMSGHLWLKPNLRNARIVAPDRPHSPRELESQRGGAEAFERKRSFRLNTNAQRLRGSEDVGPKDPQVFRILGVGESVSHGWGVEDDQTWQVRLQQRLEARGHRVEVLNAGMPSAGSDILSAYCTHIAPELQPDLVIVVRRPTRGGPQAVVQTVKDCERTTGAPTFVVLPPLSSFDLRGRREGDGNVRELQRQLGDHRVVLLDEAFEQARTGRGEILVEQDGQLQVLDQESGQVWLTVPAPPPNQDLPSEIGELFEREPEVREALIFDGGHPDAEGFEVFADALVEPVEAYLRR